MNKNDRADRHRESARKLREQANDPTNDGHAVSLRENAAEWERIAKRTEHGDFG